MVRREMHQISQGRYKWGALDQGHDRGPSRVGHKLKNKQLYFILSQNLQQNYLCHQKKHVGQLVESLLSKTQKKYFKFHYFSSPCTKDIKNVTH